MVCLPFLIFLFENDSNFDFSFPKSKIRGQKEKRSHHKNNKKMRIYLLILSIFYLIYLVRFTRAGNWDDGRINILGGGMDILQLTQMESIFVLNSEHESDPNLPIRTKTLPKGVVMIDSFTDTFHLFAEVISKNVNIKDSRDIKIDGEAKFYAVKGSFSVESKTVKQFISKMNHAVTRVSSFITLANYNLQTSGLNVSDGFYQRINLINDLLIKNTTISRAYATFLADEILNIYGTHLVIGIKTGGIISKVDAVDINSFESDVDQTLSASASASFGSYFKVNGQITTEHSDSQKYSQSVTDIYIQTIGGDSWKMNSTFDNWVGSLVVNPAVTGIKLVYILTVIREQYFPNITFDQLINVRNWINTRVDVYLKNNYYLGCDDPTASNYVSYANVFDESLCNYQYTFHFGGMFTMSNNPSYVVNNILTETTSCPSGFEAKPLLSLSFPSNPNYFCLWYWKYCYIIYTPIQTTTYVCMSAQNQTNGMYFGGIYTNNIPNDITQDKTCPNKYIAWPIYHSADQSVVSYVCMAPYDIGKIVSLPFGGIFSNQYPNYLVNGSNTCGGGFERHPVGPNPISELTYCIGLGSLDTKDKDIIPPGYGNDLNQMIEPFPIAHLPDGSILGIKVDPMSSKSYHDQVLDIAETVKDSSDEKNHQLESIQGHDVEHYLSTWLQAQRSQRKLGNNLEEESKSDNSLAITLGIFLPVVAVLVASIVIIVVYYRRQLRRSQREYIEI